MAAATMSVHRSEAALLSMPVEILCDILVLLDPISLIAVSQTARPLRAIIDPTHHDFVERLLALELLPKHGGIIPLFRSRNSSFKPPMTEWLPTNKYACSLCLKLRSHMHFDNHSIMRLGLRKPPPRSREETKLTTWKFLDRRDPASKQKTAHQRSLQRAQAEKERLERLAPERAAYHQYSTGVGFPRRRQSPFEYANFEFWEADAENEWLEKMLCGTERHKRACNHCRHLRGDWAHPSRPLRPDHAWFLPHRTLSNPGAPIVTSRQVSRPHVLERNFPGLIDFLSMRNPDLDLFPADYYLGYRPEIKPNCRHETWTLYTAYCGSCTQWHELAGFGYYLCHPQEIPTLPFDQSKYKPIPWPALCHRCSQTEDPLAFSQRLSRAAIQIATITLDAITLRLTYGWDKLYGDFELYGDQNFILKPFVHSAQHLWHGLPWQLPTGDGRFPRLKLDEAIIPELSIRFDRLELFLRNELPPHMRELYVQNCLEDWLEDYHLYQTLYLEFKKIIARIEEQPDLVEAYIAERQPYKL